MHVALPEQKGVGPLQNKPLVETGLTQAIHSRSDAQWERSVSMRSVAGQKIPTSAHAKVAR